MDSLALAKLLIRSAELCFALIALWWIRTQIPLAGEYLRRLSVVLVSPLFVFLLCHVIIASLIADSGKFSLRRRSEPNDAVRDRDLGSAGQSDAVSEPSDEIVFEDKQVISESTAATAIKADEESESENEVKDDHSLDLRLYQSWRSENFERENLRQSESEKCVDVVVFSGDGRTGPAENLPHSHDKMSDEDFNRSVEAFIAKHHKFRRQEDSPDLTRRLCASPVTAVNS